MAKPGVTKDKLVEVAFDLIWNQSYGSVSVADICERAGVNKGSFYHFFESKTDLAVAAYEASWQEKRPMMDKIFSPQVPPLERIQKWLEYMYEGQRQKAEKYGHVCGCPYASVGAEVATQDEKLRQMTEELISRTRKYIESAIADAVRAGSIIATDPEQAARRIHCICVGSMVEAKVQNSLEPLKDVEPAVMRLLGAKTVAA